MVLNQQGRIPSTFLGSGVHISNQPSSRSPKSLCGESGAFSFMGLDQYHTHSGSQRSPGTAEPSCFGMWQKKEQESDFGWLQMSKNYVSTEEIAMPSPLADESSRRLAHQQAMEQDWCRPSASHQWIDCPCPPETLWLVSSLLGSPSLRIPTAARPHLLSPKPH